MTQSFRLRLLIQELDEGNPPYPCTRHRIQTKRRDWRTCKIPAAILWPGIAGAGVALASIIMTVVIWFS